MSVLLRKIHHPQAHNNYRVVLKEDGEETEVGSIGIQHGTDGAKFWAWGIDTVIPMREIETQGTGQDRKDCMKRFRGAWEPFAADPARLTEFLTPQPCLRLHRSDSDNITIKPERGTRVPTCSTD